jgi:hypothetical protein
VTNRKARTYTKPFTIDRSQFDALAVATILLAICAYPEANHLSRGSSAHRFYIAMFSWLMRRAKAAKKIRKLPPWVLPRQQEFNTIKQGLRRLDDTAACHMMFLGLSMRRALEANFAGKSAMGMAITFSPDFSRMELLLSDPNTSAQRALDASPRGSRHRTAGNSRLGRKT